MLTINGFWLNQRDNEIAPKIFIFTMKAKDLLEYCKTEIVTRNTTGIQRILIDSRVKNVQKFFNKNEKNIIPTSIFVSITKTPTIPEGETLNYDEKTLNFEFQDNEKFITIIDGQHRLQGMSEVNGNINVLVSAMIKPEEIEEAFQFIIINNKSHKVPADHVKSIIANYEQVEESLSSRLKEVGVSVNKQIPNIDLIDTEDDSPLRGLINWTNNPNGIITLTAIEQVLNYIEDRIQEAKEDSSIKRDILYQVWRAISEKYSDIWIEHTDNHLFEKSPFLVLTSMLIDNAFAYCDIMIEMGNDITLTDSDTFYDATTMYLKKFPKEFWTNNWTKKGLDTAAGRIIIKNSIQQVKTNIRNKEENIFIDVDILN